jgi:diacylglycerol kinase (ATP)
VSAQYLAIVNPAAGGGRCGKLVEPALDRLRAAGIGVDVIRADYPGHATQIAREAYARGQRHFIAVGGDGTSYEIVNGLFPDAESRGRPTLGFLPLGTGNSFLRDFSHQGLEYAIQTLTAEKTQPCDVIRLTHKQGVLYYINLLSVGFAADVAATRKRRFKSMGELGYLLAVFSRLITLNRRAFSLRTDGQPELDRRPCLFLSFNNSKFTGGKMMIAPQADISDGLIEYVRWGPIGRLGLIRNLHTLYDGSHLRHPLASRQSVHEVEFEIEGPTDVMIDGEVLTLHCEKLDVLPSGLNVLA